MVKFWTVIGAVVLFGLGLLFINNPGEPVYNAVKADWTQPGKSLGILLVIFAGALLASLFD
jgi:hypothetical protein